MFDPHLQGQPCVARLRSAWLGNRLYWAALGVSLAAGLPVFFLARAVGLERWAASLALLVFFPTFLLALARILIRTAMPKEPVRRSLRGKWFWLPVAIGVGLWGIVVVYGEAVVAAFQHGFPITQDVLRELPSPTREVVGWAITLVFVLGVLVVVARLARDRLWRILERLLDRLVTALTALSEEGPGTPR